MSEIQQAIGLLERYRRSAQQRINSAYKPAQFDLDEVRILTAGIEALSLLECPPWLEGVKP